MGWDPDQPTRRIPPQPPPGYGAREREYAPGDPAAVWQQEVLDRIGSLRTAVALLGVLAVIALGIAVWALVKASEDNGAGTSGTASSQRVTRLENRVDDLESRLGDRATKDSVASLRSDVQDLQDQVRKASSSSGDVEQSVSDLKDEVDQLTQRVDDLASQQAGAGTTTTP